MGQHKNAKLTPKGRAEMVRRVMDGGESPKAVATALGLSPRTVRRWVGRWMEAPKKADVFEDRSSRPGRSPSKTSEAQVERIVELRRQRLCYAAIAEQTGVSKPTICRVLRTRRLNRLRDLEPAEPVVRYEHAAPGELLHFDIKKLGRIERAGHRVTRNRRDHVRGAGWEFVHVVIDDHSRIAFAALLPDEKQESAVAFLDAALAFYARLGIKPQRIMTDNGSCYRSRPFAQACSRHHVRHLRTRPYRPKTNGKAERFIQTITREWAYSRSYSHSDERLAHLLPWLHRYNWHRPHSSLNRMPPVSRLNLDGNNLLRLHT